MKTTRNSDKKLILQMLESSFMTNPTIKALCRQHNGHRKIRPLLGYAYHYCRSRNGVFLSDQKNCVAFYYRSTAKGNRIKDLFYLLRFIVSGVRWSCIRQIAAHMSRIKKFKDGCPDYYHFWFLASTPDSQVKTTRAFLTGLFKMADDQQVPIYAETTIPKNKFVFARYGFEVQETIVNEALDLTVYLMIRPPSQSRKADRRLVRAA